MGLLNFIPGVKTLGGVLGGVGKLLTGHPIEAVKSVLKGASQDIGGQIALAFVPGVGLATSLALGVGLTVADKQGFLDSAEDKAAQQQAAAPQQQSPGYW
jgi:hypothetical protein